MNTTVTIQVIKMILLSNLFFSFQLSAMQEVAIIPGLSDEISRKIFSYKPHEKPWENFDHFIQLKFVCTAWKKLIGTKEDIIKKIDIPPMHFAAMTDDIQKITELKAQGFSILELDTQKIRPTSYALACNREKSLKFLGLGFADDNFKYQFDEHERENNPLIKKLIPTTDSIIAKIYTLTDLQTAISNNDYDETLDILFYNGNLAIQYFFKNKNTIPTNNKLNSLIMYCISSFTENYFFGHINNNVPRIPIFFTLLEMGLINPNTCDKFGTYFLHYLCSPEKKDFNDLLVKFLALETIDANIKDISGSTPLHRVANNGYVNALTALLQTNKCDINALSKDELTPLCLSVYSGHHSCVESLLKNGAKITVTMPDGKNLLHFAAMNGHAKILDTLMPSLKQCINHTDNLGRTPLICCVIKNAENADLCIKSLLGAGADMQATTNNGQVALHYAAGFNRPEAAQILLKKGARVDTLIDQNEPIQGILYKNYTPLHLAAHRGHCDIIKLLLQHGANTKLKTATGKTALDLAREYKHEEAVKLLL